MRALTARIQMLWGQLLLARAQRRPPTRLERFELGCLALVLAIFVALQAMGATEQPGLERLRLPLLMLAGLALAVLSLVRRSRR